MIEVNSRCVLVSEVTVENRPLHSEPQPGADFERNADVSPVHPVWWGIILPSHLPQPYEGAQAGR